MSKLSTFDHFSEFFKKQKMSGIERKYQRDVDDLILNASPEELKKIQEIDITSQLSGNSFYDSYSNHNDDVKLTSHTSLPKKNPK